MKIDRPMVNEETYRGRRIVTSFMGPDLLCHVDDMQIGDYWIDARSALAGGRRYVDQVEDEKTKKKGRSKK